MWPSAVFKVRTFDSTAFSVERTLISLFAVPPPLFRKISRARVVERQKVTQSCMAHWLHPFGFLVFFSSSTTNATTMQCIHTDTAFQSQLTSCLIFTNKLLQHRDLTYFFASAQHTSSMAPAVLWITVNYNYLRRRIRWLTHGPLKCKNKPTLSDNRKTGRSLYTREQQWSDWGM